MRYIISKLDGRNPDHNNFDWKIEFSKIPRWEVRLAHQHEYGTGALEFDRCRRWFNATYGWSQDVVTRAKIDTCCKPEDVAVGEVNPHWAYSIIYKDYRIYVAGDKEIAWFRLAHSQT